MDDFPDPETPVITTSLFFGSFRSMFLRLLLLAPLMKISCLLALSGAFTEFLPVLDFVATLLVDFALAFGLEAVDLEGVLAEAAIEKVEVKNYKRYKRGVLWLSPKPKRRF